MLNQESVYHYTTAKGLKGILESKALFATHHNFLNDTTEINKGLELFFNEKDLFKTQIIDKYKDAYILKNNVAMNLPSNEFEYIGDLFDQFWENFENFRNSISVFITSFTFIGDSLNHWGHYGNEGTSYCIKFNKEKLSSAYNMPLNAIVSKEEVRYDKSVTDIINSFTDLFSKGVMQGLDNEHKSSYDLDSKIGILFAECLTELLFEAALIKGSEFFQEQEYRSILIFPDKIRINGNEPKCYFECTKYDELENEMRKTSNLQFRCSEHGVFVPYHSVPFDIDSIEEIIIGKSMHKEDSVKGLDMLLESLDLNIKVTSTVNSFRSF